jgi:hypothetical protein
VVVVLVGFVRCPWAVSPADVLRCSRCASIGATE